MKVNKFKKFFGWKYVINESKTKHEIHFLGGVKTQCKITCIKNGRQVRKKEALKLINTGLYDGCKYCFKGYHKL